MATRTIDEYMALPYTRVLVPDEGGGYFAEILELAGCLADGGTPDEAMRRLDESMEAWLEVAVESGKPIPEPLAAQEYSGRLLIRMPKWMHREITRRAHADGVSLNQWILAANSQQLGLEGYVDELRPRVEGLVQKVESLAARLGRLVDRPQVPTLVDIEQRESATATTAIAHGMFVGGLEASGFRREPTGQGVLRLTSHAQYASWQMLVHGWPSSKSSKAEEA